MKTLNYLFQVLFLTGRFSSTHGMEEDYRLQMYAERNYTWPIEKFVPDTKGWRKLMQRRIEQVERINGIQSRYNGWMNVVTSALVSQNFTENGWGLTRAPEIITKELKNSLHDGLRDPQYEAISTGIEGLQPYFIKNPSLNERVSEFILHFISCTIFHDGHSLCLH